MDNKYLPCSCYGAQSKVCTVGCGCPCHSTPEFSDKLRMIKEEYDNLLSKANGSSGLTGDEVDAFRAIIPILSDISEMATLIKSISELWHEMTEVIEWYKRIKNV